MGGPGPLPDGPGDPQPPMAMFCVVAVRAGRCVVHTPPESVGTVHTFETTKVGAGKVVVKLGNQDATVGTFALPEPKMINALPAITVGSAMAGPTSTPGGIGTGAVPEVGGKVGGGPPPWPTSGGGRSGVNSGNTPLPDANVVAEAGDDGADVPPEFTASTVYV